MKRYALLAVLMLVGVTSVAVGKEISADQFKDVKALSEELQKDPKLISSKESSRVKSWTLLHQAANDGYLDAVKLLLKSGADVNAKTDDGDTPLIRAVKGHSEAHYQIASFLIESGADVSSRNKNDEDAFSAAVFEVNGSGLFDSNQEEERFGTKMLTLLLEHGAKVNPIRRDRTPLECVYESKEEARTFGKEFHSEWLIRFLEARGGVRSVTPLAEAIEKGDIERLKKLLMANTQSLDTTGISRITLLMRAVQNNNLEMVKLLIDAGAKVNVENDNGETALNFAKSKEMEAFLKQKGAILGEGFKD